MTNNKTETQELTICFGTDGYHHETYEFKTEAEAKAFLRGVDDAIGYMEYRIVVKGTERLLDLSEFQEFHSTDELESHCCAVSRGETE